ncbi:hypothetical protein AKO1_011189 [Acrasis kona]|uniref:IQCH-like ATP-grasp domain-containing protein n=1 Tax=Acrasis kona TaxID=1008807 RepID=A0AAW2YUY3_9EUKA
MLREEPTTKKHGLGSKTYKELIQNERLLQVIMNSNRQEEARRTVIEKFNIPKQRPASRRSSGRKSAGLLKSISIEKSPKDAKQMDQLLDFSVTSKPAQKHLHFEKNIRRPLQTLEFSNDFTALKLDVTNPPYVNSSKDRLDMVRKAQSVVNVIAIGAQNDVTIFANKESNLKRIDQTEVAAMLANAKKEESPQKRTFEALMDEFSTHTIVVRDKLGPVYSPEFESFQRTYYYIWGPILTVIQKITKMLGEYGFAFILPLLITLMQDTKKLRQSNIKVNFKQGKFGKELAAMAIQKTWRRYVAQKRYKYLKEQNKSAIIIQKAWRLSRKLFATRREIKRRQLTAEQQWRKKQDRFRENWSVIKTKKRTIIHVPSLTYEVHQRKSIQERFQFIQNAQLFRLCALMDDLVDVIYVSPFPVSDDAIQYVAKILLTCGINNPEKRFRFVYPESFDRYTEHTSLSRSLLNSERTLKHIRTLIMGKEEVYMVQGVQNKDDYRLAVALQVPVMGADPSTNIIYSTKSGCRRIFAAADLNTPPGVYDVHSERELLLQLSKTIIRYPEYQQWLIKIDNEFEGRGTAVLDLSKVTCLSEQGRTQIMEQLASQNNMDEFLAILQDKLYFELREGIGSKIKLICNYVYKDWMDFMHAFKRMGGVIEAVPQNVVGSPVANLFIEPDGTVNILSIQEQLISPQFCTLGSAFPQGSVPHEPLRDASMSIGRILSQKQICGYVSVQYIAYINNQNALKLWGIDINLNLTNSSLFHQVFDHISGGVMDQHTGQYVSRNGGSLLKKSYVYSGLMRHEQFKTWRHSAFFSLCRQKGISFDMSTKTGCLFHLVDSLSRGLIGIICLGKTPTEAIVLFADVINFITGELNDDFIKPVNHQSNMHALIDLSQELVSKCMRHTKY